MNVPPFIPLPIEVPGNVTTEPYLVRVNFVKRVAALHFLSAGLVALSALPAVPTLPQYSAATGAMSLLIVLSLIRTAAQGARWEQWVSLALSPAMLFLLGRAIREAQLAGWPIWSIGVGIAASLLYALFCGRDLSFVGMYVLAGLASGVAIAGIGMGLRLEVGNIVLALALNALALFYHVYDLGALLSRRKLGEEAGAVVDLYRDLLNFVGYAIRSVHHWREHRIWVK